LGGSDPTFGGFQPPNAFRRRGSLPPNLFIRFAGSVAGTRKKKTIKEFEYKREEIKTMALIAKVEPKQEKKVVSARLDEETHLTLQRYAMFLGDATHEYIIGESLKRLFRRDKEFKEWLDKTYPASSAKPEASPATKSTTRSVPSAA
jgi:hypothetical protein